MSHGAAMSLIDLFRVESETQTHVLTSGLLELERNPGDPDQLERCMRAAHSLKGAARIVGLDVAVRVTHSLEDCFVAAQQGRVTLGRDEITALLAGTDLLVRIANTPEDEFDGWVIDYAAEVEECAAALAGMAGTKPAPGAEAPGAPAAVARVAPPHQRRSWVGRDNTDRALRVSTENLNRLLGLAGESLVESKWLKPFNTSLLRLKRMQHEASNALDELREPLSAGTVDAATRDAVSKAHGLVVACQQVLSERLAELEEFDRRSVGLSSRLHHEALACRMRPFADGVQAFPRMVRDLAASLGKSVRLEIVGEMTRVDRDILAGLDAPLGHLLSNAVDHGIESPEARRAAGKPEEGVIRLEARHSAGLLQVSVSDDGPGVNLEAVRAAVTAKGLINPEAAARLGDTELLDFLFLPGFTMKDTVTDVSGRGVGLDAVLDMVKRVHGTVRVHAQPGKGTQFQLLLPVTMSVVRTLLVEIGGEPYAFPLVGIVRTLKIAPGAIARIEGREHFDLDGRRVGLIQGRQALGLPGAPAAAPETPVIVLGDPSQPYGLVVDRFLGERELAVRPIDPLLGKIKDVSSAALMEDGSPVLIVDIQDLVRTMDRLSHSGRLNSIAAGKAAVDKTRTRRVLVVDDSLTVRELERKMLNGRGYDVEVAVDGMDGWNAVRAGEFDLVVTDVDMPRMDGIELVEAIRKDPRLESLPVIIVSYKDRDEDRARGLEAGAAYYLTKGSFHDDTFLQAVVDLVGEAHA